MFRLKSMFIKYTLAMKRLCRNIRNPLSGLLAQYLDGEELTITIELAADGCPKYQTNVAMETADEHVPLSRFTSTKRTMILEQESNVLGAFVFALQYGGAELTCVHPSYRHATEIADAKGSKAKSRTKRQRFANRSSEGSEKYIPSRPWPPPARDQLWHPCQHGHMPLSKQQSRIR